MELRPQPRLRWETRDLQLHSDEAWSGGEVRAVVEAENGDGQLGGEAGGHSVHAGLGSEGVHIECRVQEAVSPSPASAGGWRQRQCLL